MATVKQLMRKVTDLKEISPDDRIALNEEITELRDELDNLAELLQNLPDAEPEEGVQDRRAVFIDKLIAAEKLGEEAKAKATSK